MGFGSGQGLCTTLLRLAFAQACFRAGATPTYDNLCSKDDTGFDQITSAGTTLISSRGVVMFLPSANEIDTDHYTRFSFRLEDPTDASLVSEEGHVDVAVLPLGEHDATSAPSLAEVTMDDNAEHVFLLNDSDVSSAATLLPFSLPLSTLAGLPY